MKRQVTAAVTSMITVAALAGTTIPAQAATVTAEKGSHSHSAPTQSTKKKKKKTVKKRVVKRVAKKSKVVKKRTTKRSSRYYSRASRSAPRRVTNVAARPKSVTVKTPSIAAPNNSSIIRTAAGLSGIYYKWGGTTTAGFDCSGYVQHVHKKNGINLPRTAEAQRRATVRTGSPRPGDLVFFGIPAYHVGIYAGGNMMYDSPRTGRTTGLHKIWSSNVTYGRVR